jgi:surface carbohydrate biosynthesis protein
MRAHRIVILVDNPLRDLPACLLLAGYLSSETEVFLTPTAQATQDIFRLRPDLVLLNYLRVTNLPLVHKLIAARIAYSILDTEGGIFMKIPGTQETSFTMTLVKDQKARDCVQQVFCWGEAIAQLLREKKIYASEKIFCLGTPRMDFYHSSFKPKDLVSLKRLLTSQKNPVILLNTSFSGINPKFSTRSEELEMLVQKFGYSRDFMARFFDQLNEVMNGYIELTKYLANKFPDLCFVLRPHPFESLTVYKNALHSFKNVQVDASGTVVPWIQISEALIHYECSTAMESSFSGKPNLSLAKYQNVRPMDAVNLLTDYAMDFEEMSEKISQIVSGKYSISSDKSEALLEIEKNIFYKVDGKAYLRIGDEIKRWLKTADTQTPFMIQALRISIFLATSLRSLAKRIVKSQLLPEGKRLKLKDAQEICVLLREPTKLYLTAAAVPLSTSLQISRIE